MNCTTRRLISFAVSALAATSALAAAPSKDLPNFAQVGPGLYRGAAPTPEGLREIKAMGVTTVVDLRIAPKTVAKERALVKGLGMGFVNLPMGSDPPTPKQVEAFLAAANAAPAHPLYVHCQHGADRTGCMFGIYRVVHDRWSYARAYKEMRHYGFKPYYTKLSQAVHERSKG
ncbi:MAG: tyrosine-protein phosphatase [Capsulimonadaceae bacterium]|nr:tyrosine-protein phosphatase [Capsulimonadaceae bacterium]